MNLHKLSPSSSITVLRKLACSLYVDVYCVSYKQLAMFIVHDVYKLLFHPISDETSNWVPVYWCCCVYWPKVLYSANSNHRICLALCVIISLHFVLSEQWPTATFYSYVPKYVNGIMTCQKWVKRSYWHRLRYLADPFWWRADSWMDIISFLVNENRGSLEIIAIDIYRKLFSHSIMAKSCELGWDMYLH